MDQTPRGPRVEIGTKYQWRGAGPTLEAMRRAVAASEAVHGVPADVLSVVSLPEYKYNPAVPDIHGHCTPPRGLDSPRLRVWKQAIHPEMVTLHEQGHWLDNTLFCPTPQAVSPNRCV